MLKFSIGILLLASVISAAESFSCPGQSCLGKLSEENEKNRICKCDPDCHSYGDCCEDLSRRRVNKTLSIDKKFMECLKADKLVKSYMVKECPGNHYLAKLCGKQLPPKKRYHFSLDLPVYSAKKKLFFANIFCAQCHSEKEDLVFPSVMDCTSQNLTLDEVLSRGVFNRSDHKWYINGQGTCQHSFIDLPKDIRKCYTGVIRECPPGKSRFRCGFYSQIVRGSDEKLYGSPDCAACNGVTNHTCQEGPPFVKDEELMERIPPPSFKVLMSIDWRSCQGSTFWDPLKGDCVDLLSEDNWDDNLSTNELALSYLTAVCLTVSVICLFLHLLKHCCLAKTYNWNTLPRYQTNSLVVTLLVFQAGFLLGVRPAWTVSKELCGGVGAVLYFLGLSVFFWMNSISYDLWRTFSVFQIRLRPVSIYWKFAVYSYGVPALLTLLVVVMQFMGSPALSPDLGNRGLCWITNSKALALYFFLPSLIIIVANTVLFILTIKWLHNTMNNSRLLKHASGRKEYKRFWLYVRFSLIMGLTWVFAIVASFAQTPILWYPFVLLCGLQGAFIFFLFDFKTSLHFFSCGLWEKKRSTPEEASGQTISSKVDA